MLAMCVCVEGAFDNFVAITMRDVNSRRVPTPGLDRHTSRPVIIQSTPVPPTTLCPLPGSLALCLCTRVVPRCHGLPRAMHLHQHQHQQLTNLRDPSAVY
jgi:hypothetical protein